MTRYVYRYSNKYTLDLDVIPLMKLNCCNTLQA